MISFLKAFDPREWIWHIAGVGAAVLLVWYLVSTYNNYVSRKAVEANNKTWVTKFNQNTKDLKTLGQQFVELKAQVVTDRNEATRLANLQISKEKNRADKATQQYRAGLETQKQLAKERDNLVVGNTDLRNRLHDIAKPLAARDGDSAEIRRLSKYAEGLGSLHEKCERDLAVVRQAAARATDRAAEAEAGVRALIVEPTP